MGKWWAVALGVIATVSLTLGWGDQGYRDHPRARELMDRMVTEYGFSRDDLEALFSQARKQQSIIELMERPAEKVKPWYEYRQIFLNEKRIDLGARFWRDNRVVLERAFDEYGVDPAIVVAILGVETYYGRNKGNNRVMDALSTLAFDYPKRSKFFTRELEQFLLLSREQRQDPLALTGSYAGAMGYGQFMPSSYRNYARDYDGDEFADIWDNPADAIGSVANYFASHGWQRGQAVASRARINGAYNDSLLNKLQPPELTVAELSKEGFFPVADLPGDVKAMPLRLHGDGVMEFWLGLSNFYVITRYNRSHRYAMAVYQLSERVRERVGGATY